jgi:hypothetical protein
VAVILDLLLSSGISLARMIRLWFYGGVLLNVVCGCTTGPGYAPPGTAAVPPLQANPLFVPAVDKDFLFDQIVDVVDDYFQIVHQDRPHQLGDVITEGRIETLPETASTIFEPWRKDSVTPYEKWESTLQSTRRKASLRMVPAQGGYMVEVAVVKELEDIKQPARFFAADQKLQTDQFPDRYVDPATQKLKPTTWFPLRRDAPLEQEILMAIQARVSAAQRYGVGTLQSAPWVPAPAAPIIISTPPPLSTPSGIFPPPNELPPPPVR